MESIYFVISWLCHRRCRHCYDERFRPYRRDELTAVVAQSRRNVPRIVDHLPPSMTYRARDGGRRVGRVILAGGEVLLEPIRESVLYPAMEGLARRYRDAGGVRLIVQTTGDRLTPRLLDELLERGVHTVSVSGFDDYHVGMARPERAAALRAKLLDMFAAAGLADAALPPGRDAPAEHPGPCFNIFGATPESWIGRLWPRGRAWRNGLSTAGMEDNFCARWSGAKGFMELGRAGSEVSIEPTGEVYPCCIKTGLPLGNLLDEPLESIVAGLRGDPVYESLNRGEPQAMGLGHGWSRERFLRESTTATPKGGSYRNLCIGCDAFHDKVLKPRLEASRAARSGGAGAVAPRHPAS